ncbi:MAG: siphovirus Gp157 family protein [Cyanobacteria bacterium]|nr:siphovirus Gp157 family protein [Cyanobacteriota bacterium]
MTVLTAIKSAAPATSAQAEAPSPGLWQLGIENQELTSRVARLAEQLDIDDPELRSQAIGELEAALLQEEGHRQALDSKADSYCWVIEHLRGQAAYRQQQAKRLVELARGEESRADALEESLVLVLTKLQPTAARFSFPHHELTSRKSQAVEIDDEDSLPPEWLSIKTTSQPDKAAIKEALKAGHPIPGAHLISRRTWRIR